MGVFVVALLEAPVSEARGSLSAWVVVASMQTPVDHPQVVEEDCAHTAGSAHAWQHISLFGALSWRGLNQIKLAYTAKVGRMAGSINIQRL